jgi:hypothetical protein
MDSANNPKASKIIFLFIGLLLGSLVVTGLFFIMQKDKTNTTSKESTNRLEINSPVDNLATSQKSVEVSGTTTPNSTITVNSGQKSIAIYSSDGKFSTTLDLVEGQNTINISSFTEAETKSLSRSVLYLDQDLDNL